MAIINFDYHPQFFTATILKWQTLLADDDYKQIIIKSLHFLKKEGSIVIYGFVIMPNHIHLIWQIQDGFDRSRVQLRFLKFTAQQFKFLLIKNRDVRLEKFRVEAKDRDYQFWKRNPLSVDLYTPVVFMQKLEYIHHNPVQPQWRLSDIPEEYRFSSARFYWDGTDGFDLVSHYEGD